MNLALHQVKGKRFSLCLCHLLMLVLRVRDAPSALPEPPSVPGLSHILQQCVKPLMCEAHSTRYPRPPAGDDRKKKNSVDTRRVQ